MLCNCVNVVQVDKTLLEMNCECISTTNILIGLGAFICEIYLILVINKCCVIVLNVVQVDKRLLEINHE